MKLTLSRTHSTNGEITQKTKRSNEMMLWIGDPPTNGYYQKHRDQLKCILCEKQKKKKKDSYDFLMGAF